MSTSEAKSCVFCLKTCKSSDSRPYPTLKSDQRIHNRCQLKKNLADKKQSSSFSTVKNLEGNPSSDTKPIDKLQERFAQEREGLLTASSERKLQKLSRDDDNDPGSGELASESSTGQFFFDLKAGIAKPHEKRRYLHHKKITDTAARFDDDGFKEEAIGRAYDHSGKDLNALGDESDDELGPMKTKGESSNRIGVATKRKIKSEFSEKRPRKKEVIKLTESNPCWFCLSSDKVEKHLIVSIGQHCYLALAKGGLLDDHLMIMPIEHIMCTSDEKSNHKDLLLELESFKESLVNYFDKQSKGVVFFERNVKSVHWQLQAVPIPIDNIVSVETDIKSISKKYYKNSNYIDLPDNCAVSQKVKHQEPYFFWQIEPLGTRFLAPIDAKDSSFPIQLGRMVLSDPSILNCPDRIDWKTCVKSTEEYERIVDEIKESYNEFDPSQQ